MYVMLVGEDFTDLNHVIIGIEDDVLGLFYGMFGAIDIICPPIDINDDGNVVLRL